MAFFLSEGCPTCITTTASQPAEAASTTQPHLSLLLVFWTLILCGISLARASSECEVFLNYFIEGGFDILRKGSTVSVLISQISWSKTGSKVISQLTHTDNSMDDFHFAIISYFPGI